MGRAGFFMLALLSLGVAGYAIIAYGLLPPGAAVHPDLRASFEAHRVVLYAHVFASTVALALGPWQFPLRPRAARPARHRWLGRLYLGAGVLIGGLSGLFMAVYAFGGGVARLGFATLALAWLFTGWRAYRAIRARQVTEHRRWMVRNFSLSFAAVTLRLWLPAAMAAGLAFETAYAVIAWLCWLPNLLAAEYLLRHTRAPRDSLA